MGVFRARVWQLACGCYAQPHVGFVCLPRAGVPFTGGLERTPASLRTSPMYRCAQANANIDTVCEKT